MSFCYILSDCDSRFIVKLLIKVLRFLEETYHNFGTSVLKVAVGRKGQDRVDSIE